MKKTLLILGAGLDQLFMIRTAKSMGLNTLVFDWDPNAPGFKEADYYACVSTRDLNNMIKEINNFLNNIGQINGVSTMGSDIPHMVSALSKYLGTPSVSERSAKWATNKYEMKNRFTKYGVRTPFYKLIKTSQEAKNLFNELKCPIILKPLDQAGSRGVSLVRFEDEIEYLFENAFNNSGTKSVLLEKFLIGPQISTESILINGDIHTPGFSDRNYDQLDNFLPHIMENGGWVPSVFEDRKKIVEDELKKAAESLEIRNGVVKGDVVMHNDKPYIIEIAARLSGGDFCEGLVPYGIGVNYVEEIIRQAIGIESDVDSLKPKFNKVVVNRYFFAKSGKLLSIK